MVEDQVVATVCSTVVRLFAVWTIGPRFNSSWVQELCLCVWSTKGAYRVCVVHPNLLQKDSG
jgi:hypothetical protein